MLAIHEGLVFVEGKGSVLQAELACLIHDMLKHEVIDKDDLRMIVELALKGPEELHKENEEK